MTEVCPIVDGQRDAKDGRYRNLSADTQGFPASEPPKIIAFTAHVHPDVRKKCTEASMIDYVHKPVSLNELEAILMKYLKSLSEVS